MTWSPNATFTTQLEARHNAPVFVAVIDGVSTIYATGDVTFAGKTTKQILSLRSAEGSELDFLRGGLALGELSISLADRDGEALSLISTDRTASAIDSLGYRKIDLYWGFEGFAEGNFELFQTYNIESVSMPRPGEYVLRCVDPLPQLANPLFSSLGKELRTTLRADASATTNLTVADAAGFAAGDSLLIIDTDGALTWTDVASTTQNANDDDVIAVNDTQTVSQGAEVYRAWMIEGNVVNILARILLDDFATTGDVNTTFPLDDVNGTFASGDGFGLASTALDIADITDVRANFLEDIKGRLILTERIDNAPGFLRNFSTGLFSLYQKRGGALSINSIRLPFFESAQETLDDDDSRLIAWARSFRDAYNYVTVEGDELPNGDSSVISEIDRTADASGIGRRDFVVKSPWLRSDLSGGAVAATMGSRIASRFSRGPIGVQLLSAFERAKLEPGDYVEITHPLMPDTAATLTPQGVQIKAQISTVRGGLIPPNTVTNYTTETSANQNKYLFISDDDGLDPDGSPAAVWV